MENKLISMTEEWKSVIGYEGFYEISNFGNCKSVERIVFYNNDSKNRKAIFKSKLLKKTLTEHGYIKYRLSLDGAGKSIFAHKLVALAFIVNPDNKPQINHIDSNPKNNNANNLEWVTASENLRHSYDEGFRENKYYGATPNRKIEVSQLKNGVIVKTWESIKAACVDSRFDSSSISKCCKGKLKSHKGFEWKYTDSALKQIGLKTK